MGFVYFAVGQVGSDLMVKIGYTSGDPHQRVRALQIGSPVNLDVFGWIRGSVALEQKFHRTFASLRVHGEWFEAVGKLREFIWYLSSFGAANRLTTDEELCVAVHDCLLSQHAPHPSYDVDEYLSSADLSEWKMQ